MKTVLEIARITFKGGLRDKVFITLIVISLLCFLILVPTVSSLSMRQVREVAVSLSLSIVSFISFVLTVFLGTNLVYMDIERKFTYSVISLPVSREEYIIGKFLGLSSIVGVAIVILSLFSSFGISIAAQIYPSSLPMLWENFLVAVFFEFIILIIVAAICILFSSFSTNLFVTLFATLGFYLVGNATQTVMDYVKSSYGKSLPQVSIYLSRIAYYIFPNLSVLDFKFYAIYSLPVPPGYMFTVLSYALLYTFIVLGSSLLIFRRRELL